MRGTLHRPAFRPALLVRAAAGVLAVAVLAACGGGSETNNGTLPEGVEDQPETAPTVTLSSPPPQPDTPAPTSAPSSTGPAAPAARVVVVPGRFAADPAVQGLVAKYPLYYQALVRRDSNLVKTGFPAFFFADTGVGIENAKERGWIMRPPGSIVVVGTSKQPYGVTRLNLCRSQTLQWFDPRTRRYVVNAPRGTGEAIDMVRTGLGWTMYRVVRPVPAGINCAAVSYPA